MGTRSTEETKALVLKAFDTLFNKRDYVESGGVLVRETISNTAPTWSLAETVCSTSSAASRTRCAMRTHTSWQRATM